MPGSILSFNPLVTGSVSTARSPIYSCVVCVCHISGLAKVNYVINQQETRERADPEKIEFRIFGHFL